MFGFLCQFLFVCLFVCLLGARDGCPSFFIRMLEKKTNHDDVDLAVNYPLATNRILYNVVVGGIRIAIFGPTILILTAVMLIVMRKTR